MQQTTNVASNTQCIAVTSRQPYMRLTFRSLQRSVTLPASQTLQHNLCQTWKSPVRSRLLSGLWCVLLFLEHRNFPGMNRQDARRAAQHVDDWLTDRHWNTEAESHFSREWNWGKERSYTPYTEPQRHPSVRDGHMSARSLTGLKISIHLFNISSIIYLSVRLTVYLSVHPSVRLSIQLSVCLYL